MIENEKIFDGHWEKYIEINAEYKYKFRREFESIIVKVAYSVENR